jgi:hypothetical protein
LLGSNLERSSYTTVVTEQQLHKQACLHGNSWKQQQRNSVSCEVHADDSWSNELVVRESLASKDVNMEAEEATALEAVTRQKPVKIQQTEISYMLQ